MVHNLRQVDWHLGDRSLTWGDGFDRTVRQAMMTRPQNLMRVMRHPAYGSAVPTPELFVTLAYLGGLCSTVQHRGKVLKEGGAFGCHHNDKLYTRLLNDFNVSSRAGRAVIMHSCHVNLAVGTGPPNLSTLLISSDRRLLGRKQTELELRRTTTEGRSSPFGLWLQSARSCHLICQNE